MKGLLPRYLHGGCEIIGLKKVTLSLISGRFSVEPPPSSIVDFATSVYGV